MFLEQLFAEKPDCDATDARHKRPRPRCHGGQQGQHQRDIASGQSHRRSLRIMSITPKMAMIASPVAPPIPLE